MLFVPSGAIVDRATIAGGWCATACAALTGAVALGLSMASAFDAPVPVFYAILLAQGVHERPLAGVELAGPDGDPARGSAAREPRRLEPRRGRVDRAAPALAGARGVVAYPWAIYATIALTAGAGDRGTSTTRCPRRA